MGPRVVPKGTLVAVPEAVVMAASAVNIVGTSKTVCMVAPGKVEGAESAMSGERSEKV